jgi:hypothetical protein
MCKQSGATWSDEEARMRTRKELGKKEKKKKKEKMKDLWYDCVHRELVQVGREERDIGAALAQGASLVELFD